uniref:ATP-dependent RNA helicase DHX36 n=1 Tax=Strongyloides venezuelensis TaxID=75913 RepID=A0A0K0FT04_STRVS
MEMSEISRILQDVESKKNKNEGMEKSRRKLPVYEKKMRSSNPTGSGKSTQVAQILLKHYITQGRGGKFNCIITQPRRLSAISLAKRVAQERYEKLGDSVGYCVRFDKVDPRPFGSILFGTVGTILKKLSSGFRGVSHIIVDEVHERSLETDLLLMFLKKMLLNGCKIKIILMSATVETHEFENFFEKIKVLEIEGRSYNINETYLDEIIQHFEIIPRCFVPPQDYDERRDFWSFNNRLDDSSIFPLAVYIAELVEENKEIPYDIIRYCVVKIRECLVEGGRTGSILIFLPGWKEILRCMKEFNLISNEHYLVIPLHSKLSSKEQGKVFEKSPADKTKIILSTNIAESSVTIDDVVYVIDTCKQKKQKISQNRNKCSYKINWISRDRMDQRKGRAGRTQDGHCVRLLTKKFMSSLAQHPEPEIKSSPLDGSILTIKGLRLGDSKEFLQNGMEKIDPKNIDEAEIYLQEIGALDENRNLTYLCQALEKLSFSPKNAKCVLTGLLFNISSSLSIIFSFADSNMSLFNGLEKQDDIENSVKLLSGEFKSDAIIPLMAVKKSTGYYKDFSKDLSILKTINMDTTSMLMKAKYQTMGVLENMFKSNINIDTGCPSNKKSSLDMHLILSLLVKATCPNVAIMNKNCKFIDNIGQTVRPVENSVLSVFKSLFDFESIFNIYGQKIEGRTDKLKDCNVVSPMSILLFGSRNVVYIGVNEVLVNNDIVFRGDIKLIQMIISLDSLVDELIQSLCIKGYWTQRELDAKDYIINLVERIVVKEYKINGYRCYKKEVTKFTKVDFQRIRDAWKCL